MTDSLPHYEETLALMPASPLKAVVDWCLNRKLQAAVAISVTGTE